MCIKGFYDCYAIPQLRTHAYFSMIAVINIFILHTFLVALVTVLQWEKKEVFYHTQLNDNFNLSPVQ